MTSGFTLDGRGYARELLGAGRAPQPQLDGPCGIATLLVGDDEAAAIYQRHIDAGARRIGIASGPERLPADASFGVVVGKLAELDVDPDISGILVLRPLPAHLPESRVLRAIPRSRMSRRSTPRTPACSHWARRASCPRRRRRRS